MRATFKLINSYFWKTIYGPILSFLFPAILIAVLGNVMKIQYVYPGIISLSMLFIGVLALPLAVMELKQSSLFKYIGSSPVNHVKFSIVVVLYYTLVSIITGFIIAITSIVIFSSDVFPKSGFKMGIMGGLSSITGFFSFILSCILHLILVVSVGIAISTFSKTPQQALTISIIIILPSMFLSGMVLSVDIISQNQVMQWISRLVPFRYSTGNMVVATTPLDQLGDLYHLISNNEIVGEASNRELIFGSNVINNTPDENGLSRIDKIIDYLKNSGQTNTAHIRSILESNIGNIFFIKPSGDSYALLRNTDDILKEYRNAVSDNYVDYFFSKKSVVGFSLQGDDVLFRLIFLKASARNFSDNNIFILNKAWAVRRIPEISQIKKFIQAYLLGNGDGDISRFETIQNLFKNSNFGFMDIFLKQSNTLYTVVERSLNLLIPIAISGIAGIYIWRNFSWSNK